MLWQSLVITDVVRKEALLLYLLSLAISNIHTNQTEKALKREHVRGSERGSVRVRVRMS